MMKDLPAVPPKRPSNQPGVACRTARYTRLLSLALLGVVVPVHAATEPTELGLEQLLNVTIVGASKYEQKQSEVAAAVRVITREEIKAFGWRTLDEALASLPGIYTTYDRQYKYLGTRGFGLPGDFNTRVLVTIDGNRVNDPLYDSGPFGHTFPVDMDLIERIEFIPGPGGAVYGQNAMFGVVNVITRRGATLDGTELAAAYQNPQAQRAGRASWGRLLDNGVDVVVSVSGMRSRGEDLFFQYPGADANGYATSGVASGLDGSRDKQFFAHIARGSWSFEQVYGARVKNDPTGVYFSAPLVPGQFQGDSYALTQLQYENSFAGDTLHLTGRLFMGQYRYTSNLNYGTLFSFPAWGDWRGMELRLLSTAVNGHKLMLGLEAQDNTRIEQTAQDLAHPANNIDIPGSGSRVGLYAQDEWRIVEALTATLGMRADRNTVTGTKLSPRVGLIWQAAPATSIKALYGRAHRAPNAYERDYTDGVAQVNNPALAGESIDTLELVLDQRVGQSLLLSGSVYQWTMRGLVTLGTDPNPPFLPQYQNGEKVDAHGVELSADKTWDWGGRLRGSLSNEVVAYASGIGLNNSPRLLGKLNFSCPLPHTNLRMGYESQYYSARKTINGTMLDGYWLSNLNLTADKWAKGLEASLGFYNLFNARYEQPASDNNWQNALAQDGRSVRVKMDYRF